MLSDRCLSVCPVRDVYVLWPNGWMDQDEIWHGGRNRPRRRCVRWGPSIPHGKGHSSPPPLFGPMSIVAKRSPISVTAELLFRGQMPFRSLDQRCQRTRWNSKQWPRPVIITHNHLPLLNSSGKELSLSFHPLSPMPVSKWQIHI